MASIPSAFRTHGIHILESTTTWQHLDWQHAIHGSEMTAAVAASYRRCSSRSGCSCSQMQPICQPRAANQPAAAAHWHYCSVIAAAGQGQVSDVVGGLHILPSAGPWKLPAGHLIYAGCSKGARTCKLRESGLTWTSTSHSPCAALRQVLGSTLSASLQANPSWLAANG